MERECWLDGMSRAQLRAWYSEHADTSRECWVQLSRVNCPVIAAVSYLDAVEEALCFGWIDSVVRRMEDGVTRQRFSPRRKGSAGHWSELNKARCARLERLGLMSPAGRIALSHAKPFCIDKQIVVALRADRRVWQNFCTFPELYRRVRIDTIQIKRRMPELYAKRLAKLIAFTRCGKMYGAWNDGGRLLPEDLPPN